MKYIALFTLLFIGAVSAQTLPDEGDATDEVYYQDPCDPFYMGPELCFLPSGGGGGGDPECGAGSLPCGETAEYLPGTFSCAESNNVCELPFGIKQQGLAEGMRRLGCFNANGEYSKNFCEQGSTLNQWYKVNVKTTPSGRNYAVFFRITKYKSNGVDADLGIREL